MPAGDFDYEAGGGVGYARRRRTDPRIAAYVHAALGDARTVLNVGAGAGSYEPEDRYVIAVEPSAAMRAQRSTPRRRSASPRRSRSTTTASTRRWRRSRSTSGATRRAACASCGAWRVAAVVILTFDPDAIRRFWLAEYVPGDDRGRGAPLSGARPRGEVTPVPIPLDCEDGFIEAFYGRPEALARPGGPALAVGVGVRRRTRRGLERLRPSLESGAWDARHGHLRTQPVLRRLAAAGRGPLSVQVTVSVNGVEHTREVEPRLLLVHFLRDELGLTGTHWGCDTSNCGTCVVLMDGEPVKSCTVLAATAERYEITTVEGLERDGVLDPVQQGFHEKHGLQCGFCTSGMMLTARALLDRNPDPTDEEIRIAISGQICRCTGYATIVRSIRWAAEHPGGDASGA